MCVVACDLTQLPRPAELAFGARRRHTWVCVRIDTLARQNRCAGFLLAPLAAMCRGHALAWPCARSELGFLSMGVLADRSIGLAAQACAVVGIISDAATLIAALGDSNIIEPLTRPWARRVPVCGQCVALNTAVKLAAHVRVA